MDDVFILLALGVEGHLQVAGVIVVGVDLDRLHLALIGVGITFGVPATVLNVLFELLVELGVVTPVIGLVVAMAVTVGVVVGIGMRIVGGHCVGGEAEAKGRSQSLGGQDFAEEHVLCLNF